MDIKIDVKNSLDKFLVEVVIPDKYGFIDNVFMKVLDGDSSKFFLIPFFSYENGFVTFKREISLDTKALYHYSIEAEFNGVRYCIGKNGISRNEIKMDDCFKISSHFEVPEWFYGKIMYHVFVDRFCKGRSEKLSPMKGRIIHDNWNEDVIVGPSDDGIWNNDFFGGDLQGVIKKLDYLKSLGVSIIYLSPICLSQSNHRYDTADYENVDPYAGCNEDLKDLCDKAHRKGMRVILDAVFNHTGNDSRYFNNYGNFEEIGAWQNPNSYFGSFYQKSFKDGKVNFNYWWGFKNLPECDGNSYNWKNYICGNGGVIDKWFALGIDGLRLDVADELSDEFIENIRVAVKRNREDGFIIGEVWKDPTKMGRGYLTSGKGMDTVMNYPLMDALIRYFKYKDVDKLAYIIRNILRDYPDQTIYTLMNSTSTHDISRIINILGCNDVFSNNGEWVWSLKNEDYIFCRDFKISKEEYLRGRDILGAYAFTLAFMPGILAIFYGDEIGMNGLGNLMNRKPYSWNYQDKKILRLFRQIGMIRKREEFLATADLNLLDVNDKTLTFERVTDEELAFIAVNRTEEERKIEIPKNYESYDKVYTLKKSYPSKLDRYGAVAIIKSKH